MSMFYELMERIYQMERSGRRIIKLNIGDTQLPSPPAAVEAAERFLRDRKAEYVSSAGLPELRERIAHREGCSVDNVIIGSGSKILIYALLSVLRSNGCSGERIVFPSPYWPAYTSMCKRLGLQAEVVDTALENNWNFADLHPEGAVALIICNPLNPTSTIYPQKLIEKTIEEAGNHGVQVILDEAYKGLAFTEIPTYQGIRIRSFSKEFNMEGWRLAYAIAPSPVIKNLISFFQVTTTCTPPFIQQAGIACLDNEKEILAENVAIWKKRAAASSKVLREAGFKFATPEAGMYVFATHDGITNAYDFAMELLDQGVAVAPGVSFGEYPKFFRICLNLPEETLAEAVEKMKVCLEKQK